MAGRIGGGDFALLIPGGANAGEVAQRALELARASIQQLSTPQRIAAVVCSYRHDMAVERLLAQAEQALSQADNNSTANALVLPESDYDNRTLTSDWGLSLSEALRADRLRLVEFPVCSPSGALIHLECPVRMLLGQSEQWLHAASFVPIAQRLQLTADLDLAVVGLALEKLSLDSPDVAGNLAAESLLVPDFIPSLRALLSRHPARLNRLWMGMGEAGAFDHFPQFQAWCRTLSDLPCRLGLEHVGQRFSEVGRLHSLGIHYLKTVTGMTNSGLNSSRLGFRGVEDVGGGMQAGFHIEGQLTNDDGNAAGQTWQRRSTVSLMGGFGEVRLGRDYTPNFWNTTIYDPFGTNGVGQSLTVAMIGAATATQNSAAAVRSNNSVSYFLPGNLGGFHGQVMVAFGENVSGGAKTNNYLGFRFGYAAGPFSLAGAYAKTEGATGDAADTKYMNFGASYNMGFMSIPVTEEA